MGVIHNKNKPSDGEQNKGGNPGDIEQNSEQARIAQKNLDIIHKKFDDFYQDNKGASDKAKKIFDSVKSQINEKLKFNKPITQGKLLALRYFADIISGRIELNERNTNDILVIKPLRNEDFVLQISYVGMGMLLTYVSDKRVFDFYNL